MDDLQTLVYYHYRTMFLFALTLHALLRSASTLYILFLHFMIYIHVPDNDMVHSIDETSAIEANHSHPISHHPLRASSNYHPS